MLSTRGCTSPMRRGDRTERYGRVAEEVRGRHARVVEEEQVLAAGRGVPVHSSGGIGFSGARARARPRALSPQGPAVADADHVEAPRRAGRGRSRVRPRGRSGHVPAGQERRRADAGQRLRNRVRADTLRGHDRDECPARAVARAAGAPTPARGRRCPRTSDHQTDERGGEGEHRELDGVVEAVERLKRAGSAQRRQRTTTGRPRPFVSASFVSPAFARHVHHVVERRLVQHDDQRQREADRGQRKSPGASNGKPAAPEAPERSG